MCINKAAKELCSQVAKRNPFRFLKSTKRSIVIAVFCILVVLYTHFILLAKLTNSVSTYPEDRPYYPPHDWRRFLLNVNLTICPNVSVLNQRASDMKMVIIVNSAVRNFNLRNAYRSTIGSWAQSMGQKVYFIVGCAGSQSNEYNMKMQSLVLQESRIHGDIVQYDVIDDYYNVTFKSALMLRFFSEMLLGWDRVPQVVVYEDRHANSLKWTSRELFLLKSDDNNFVNVAKFLKLVNSTLEEYEDKTPVKRLVGSVLHKTCPDHNPHNRHYIPYHRFKFEFYPDYLQGSAYLMSSYVARSLFITALYTPNVDYMPWDDLFVTGLCAQKAVTLINETVYTIRHDEDVILEHLPGIRIDFNGSNQTAYEALHYLYAQHPFNAEDYYTWYLKKRE